MSSPSRTRHAILRGMLPRVTTTCVAFVGFLGLLGLQSSAQSPGPAHLADRSTPTRGATFKSGIDLVPLEVCVKDHEGRYLPALGPEDFLILEDGVPQRIQFFEADGLVPLAVALVIDRSSSMRGPKLDRAKAAAEAFMHELRSDDLVEIITFNERADRRYSLGADRAAARASIADVSAHGQTGLFEAILVALRDLERAQKQSPFDYRSVMLILSDGEDTSSLLTFEDVLEDVRRSGVMVYAVSLQTNARGEWQPPPFELAQFAFDTGGRAVGVRNLVDLNAIYQEIGVELRHLYRLAYMPPTTARIGAWRPISVRVTGRKNAQVRTRSGYYAPRQPPAAFSGSAR